MQQLEFMAVAIAQELNLNLIASHFGIQRKFKWEDILILTQSELKGILKKAENKTVYCFYFGCLVGVNCTKYDLSDLYNYLTNIDPGLDPKTDQHKYSESYRLEIKPDSEIEVHNSYLVVSKLVDFYPKILAIVLARSVALDRIEDNLEKVSDEIEKVIEYLDKGKFNITDNNLAKLSGKIVRYKYNTISYVMLLDKPDITWNNEGAETLFLQLTDIFDLQERYESLRHKTENLMDITEVFTMITHAKRGTRLEWMIIILIALDILISIMEKAFF